MLRRVFAPLIAALLTLAPLAPADAQQGARPVLLLISETISERGAASRPLFWWSDFAHPNWTETDRALHAELAPRGLRPAPIDRPISAIYRRADLPPGNVRALAGLLGAEAAYAGSVEFERVAERGPFGTQGWTARARVAEPGGGSWEIERARFGEERGAVVSSLRAEICALIARRVAADVASRPAEGARPDGAGDDLVVTGAWRGADLEAIVGALGALEPPLPARVRWSAPGEAGLRVGGGAEDARRAAAALTARGVPALGRPLVDRSGRGGAAVRLEPGRGGDR